MTPLRLCAARILLATNDPSLHDQVAAIARAVGSAVNEVGPDEVLSALEGSGYDVLIGPAGAIQPLVPRIDARYPPVVRPGIVLVSVGDETWEPQLREVLARTAAAQQEGDVVDLRVLDRLRELQEPGESDLVAELAAMFRVDGTARLAVLREACGAVDRELAQRTAHSLKGSAGNIGAYRLARLCGVIEHEAATAEPRILEAWGSRAADLFGRSIDALAVLSR